MAAKKKNLGILLMKSTAQDKLLGSGQGQAGVKELLRYAWRATPRRVRLSISARFSGHDGARPSIAAIL